ncbi:MAG: Pseudouridine synthase [Chlamydiales bacterium]|jgi:23S rRNA pseudouridine1911/1915/1917 synthase|nr:Pseudouridine synthase [Chlamydiales bacterium]
MKLLDKGVLKINMEILFEDNHVLVVNKPAGLLTQPNNIAKDSLELQAKAWIKTKYSKPGEVFLHAVHRIDKAVSGIVVFARTSKALSRLQSSMRNREIQKNYLALLEGHLKNHSGTLEHYLVHDDFCARVVDKNVVDGKKSRLSYLVKGYIDNYTYVEIELETGRYHQIRVQFAAIGYPIVGDIKYKASVCNLLPSEEIALHHYEISFPHPTLKNTVSVQAPLPDNNAWRLLNSGEISKV